MKRALLLVVSIFVLKAGLAASLVIDKADLFSAAEEEQLLQKIAEVHRNHNAVICVTTVASLAGKNIFDYSLEVGNSLGVGQKGLNNGMVLFIAPNERKVHLQVGFGLEWAIADEVSGRVIAAMKPYYGKRQFLEGTFAGMRQLEEQLGTVYVSVNDVSWEELLAAPGRFAGGVVKFRYPGKVKLGDYLRPGPEHAQFDDGFRLKLAQGEHVIYLRYTKYMGTYMDSVFTNRPVTVFARIDKSKPDELKLMGVLKDE
jgi:hypothetical protein